MDGSVGFNPRKDRIESRVSAVLHRADGSHSPVCVTNFSDSGCRIESPKPLPIGERLEIAIPKIGKVRAQIRWSLEGESGVRFDNEDGEEG